MIFAQRGVWQVYLFMDYGYGVIKIWDSFRLFLFMSMVDRVSISAHLLFGVWEEPGNG